MPAPALARHPRVLAAPHIGGLTRPATEHQALETVAQLDACCAASCRRRGERGDATRWRAGARRKPAMTRSLAACPARATATCTSTRTAGRSRRPRPSSRRTRPPPTTAARRAIGWSAPSSCQPTGYGFDNRCTLEALAALGPGTRAVVVVARRTSEAELARLHGLGARSVRFMMLPGGVLPGRRSRRPRPGSRRSAGTSTCSSTAASCPPRGGAARAAVPAGRSTTSAASTGRPRPRAPAFASLCRAARRGRCWVKISAPYESSKLGPPDYADIAPLARALAERYPERCLWASNWPHPNQAPRPHEQAMLDGRSLHRRRRDARRILCRQPGRAVRLLSAGDEPPHCTM
jgi:D-galactarolactone isomerase